MDGSDNYELVNEDQLVMTSAPIRIRRREPPSMEHSKEFKERERTRQELKHGRNRGER